MGRAGPGVGVGDGAAAWKFDVHAHAHMHVCRYDPLALVASVPRLASKYFEFEEVQVGSATHRIAGVSNERCGVKPGSGLPEMLYGAFIEGIKPPVGELQKLRGELVEERATTARLQQEVDRLRAMM